MLRAKRAYLLALLVSPIAIVASVMGCGTNGNGAGTGGSASTGGAGAGTGGSASTGGAGAGTGGSASTGGAGAGTGGSAPNTGGANGTGGSNGTGGAGTASGGGPSGGGVVPGTAGFDCSSASGDVPALKATPVGTGLAGAMLVTYEPNTTANRLFVLDVTGVIRIIDDGTVVGTPFMDFSSKVGHATSPGAAGDERGALGFAFHPEYATNGLFYVHYSDVNADFGDSILEEYHVSSDPNVADEASARLVKKVVQPSHGGPCGLCNHKGGAIAFGADGFLYWGLGDGGGSNDQDGNGQDLNVMLGKIHRIDPVESGSDPYTTPPDNMTGGLPEIWDYGLRNPFRFTFDGCTGDLYIGDVGQDTHEEVDIEKAGEGRKNYGWNITEGLGCRGTTTGCDQTGITPPSARVSTHRREVGHRWRRLPRQRDSRVARDLRLRGLQRQQALVDRL